MSEIHVLRGRDRALTTEFVRAARRVKAMADRLVEEGVHVSNPEAANPIFGGTQRATLEALAGYMEGALAWERIR